MASRKRKTRPENANKEEAKKPAEKPAVSLSKAKALVKNMTVQVTGARHGEFLLGTSGVVNHALLAIQTPDAKTVVVPPERKYLDLIRDTQAEHPEIYQEFMRKLGTIPFFQPLSIAQREAWLTEHQDEHHQVLLGSGTMSKVKLVLHDAGRDNVFSERVSEEDLASLLNVPHSGDEIMAAIYRQDDTNSLALMRSMWTVSSEYRTVQLAPQTVLDKFLFDVDTGQIWYPTQAVTLTKQVFLMADTYFATDRATSFAVVDPDATEESEDEHEAKAKPTLSSWLHATYIEPRTKPNVARWYRKILVYLNKPSILKSLIQKIIRFRPQRVTYLQEDIAAEDLLTQTLAMLILHRGVFNPDIQKFVTGRESAFKRLAVILAEDAWVQDTGPNMRKLFIATLLSRNPHWIPSQSLLIWTMQIAVDALTSSTAAVYDVKDGKKLTPYSLSAVPLKNALQDASALLDRIGSFDGDKFMVRDLADKDTRKALKFTKVVSTTSTMSTMPLYHFMDQHVNPGFIYYAHTSIIGKVFATLPEYLTAIFEHITGLNPRRKVVTLLTKDPQEPWIVTTREAQRLAVMAMLCVGGDKNHCDALQGSVAGATRAPSRTSQAAAASFAARNKEELWSLSSNLGADEKKEEEKAESTHDMPTVLQLDNERKMFRIHYILDDSWLGALLGHVPQKVKEDRKFKTAVVCLRTDPHKEYIVMNTPTGRSVKTELTETEKQTLRQQFAQALASDEGLPLTVGPKTSLAYLNLSHVRLKDKVFWVSTKAKKSKWVPWSTAKQLDQTIQMIPAHSVTPLKNFTSLLTYALHLAATSQVGICENAVQLFLKDLYFLAKHKRNVLRRTLRVIDHFGKVVEMPRMSRQGTGNGEMDDMFAHSLLLTICVLFPSALRIDLSRLGRFNVQEPTLFWYIRDTIRAILSTTQVPESASSSSSSSLLDRTKRVQQANGSVVMQPYLFDQQTRFTKLHLEQATWIDHPKWEMHLDYKLGADQKQLSRTPAKHQQELVSELNDWFDSGRRGNVLVSTVGSGKTMIVLEHLLYLVRTNRMPQYLFITSPQSALENLVSELEYFFPMDCVYQLILTKSKDRAVLSTVINEISKIKPFTVVIIEHDMLRYIKHGTDLSAFESLLSDSVFVCDEVHKALASKTQRTQNLLRSALLSRYFLVLTGTPVVNSSMVGLIEWLKLVSLAEVNEDNYVSVLGSIAARHFQTEIKVHRKTIEINTWDAKDPAYLAYLDKAPPTLGGKNRLFGQQGETGVRNLLHMEHELLLPYVVQAAQQLLNTGIKSVAIIARDDKHAQQLYKAFQEMPQQQQQWEAKDIYVVAKNINFTDKTVSDKQTPPWKVVIVPMRISAGYELSYCGAMLTCVYLGNQAQREQLEGRINRLSSSYTDITYVTLHMGVGTLIHAKYEHVRDTSDIIKNILAQITSATF